jgi:pyruvate dehydrogenase E1 component beta subunit
MPSTAADFKGLLKSAIRDPNPVLFFSDMTLGYNPGEVADETQHCAGLGGSGVAS